MHAKEEILAIVVPVYNEQDAIALVLEKWMSKLDAMGIDYSIHAYNDGSKDSTGKILSDFAAKSNGRIVAHDKPNSGHGPTILHGYREAAKKFHWIFQIDSDDEMGPEDFDKLWDKRANYDFLLGMRDGRNQPFPRKIVSFVSRISVRIFYGKNTVWDVNSPYRLMRVSSFSKVFDIIPADTFAPNLVISGMTAKLGLRYLQINVSQRERQTGEVSIKKWKLLKAAIRSFYQTIRISFKKLP